MRARILISTSSFGRSGRQPLSLPAQAGCGVPGTNGARLDAAAIGPIELGAVVALTTLESEAAPAAPGVPGCPADCRGWA
jgi:hypothetical protein